MLYLYKQSLQKTAVHTVLQISVLLACLLSASWLYAGQGHTTVIEVKLGDYRYMPSEIQLVVDQPVILHLVNTDLITPHNFTLEDPSDGLDVNVDIPAGESLDVHLMPLVAGSHTFYCRNKLLFMESHREKGMQGRLIVVPE